MYGNMNPGLLICRLTSEATGNVVEGATAQVTWVEADASFGGRLQLYDKNGAPTTDVRADSDAAGVALVEFFWNPTQIGYLLSNSPQTRVCGFGVASSQEVVERGTIFSDTKVSRNFETARLSDRIHLCVNLGQVMSSGKGTFQFREATSYTVGAAKKIAEILQFRAKIAGEKIPRLQILKVMRPSVEMYSLLGAVEIRMKPYA